MKPIDINVIDYFLIQAVSDISLVNHNAQMLCNPYSVHPVYSYYSYMKSFPSFSTYVQRTSSKRSIVTQLSFFHPFHRSNSSVSKSNRSSIRPTLWFTKSSTDAGRI